MASPASFLRARWAGPRVPRREGVLSIPPPTVLATTPRETPLQEEAQKETQCTETHTHTHTDRKDSKYRRRRPGRWDQTKDARRRGERSRAAGAGVEPGWG